MLGLEYANLKHFAVPKKSQEMVLDSLWVFEVPSVCVSPYGLQILI